jgi:radical SAM/Cys-rich protein
MTHAATMRGRGLPLAEPRAQLARLDGAPSFDDALRAAGLSLRAARPRVLQLHLGNVCNQTCRHCHVDAGPDRRETMGDTVLEAALRLVAAERIPTVDLTGGAPELHPRFHELVTELSALGVQVLDRCNLTILRVPRFRALPAFLAAHRVEVVASLPWYAAARTDAQRGEGVFSESLEALRELNALGYGMPGAGLTLTLVTNPVGTYLSPPQAALERDWHRELWRLHGVRFTRLFTIQNMPIARFLEHLEATGQTAAYLDRLVRAFNPAAAAGLMCRDTLSVGWDGRLYDCDFNQMLALEIDGPTLPERADLGALEGRPIRTAPHCFGCTAGGGSSCGGATT